MAARVTSRSRPLRAATPERLGAYLLWGGGHRAALPVDARWLNIKLLDSGGDTGFADIELFEADGNTMRPTVPCPRWSTRTAEAAEVPPPTNWVQPVDPGIFGPSCDSETLFLYGSDGSGFVDKCPSGGIEPTEAQPCGPAMQFTGSNTVQLPDSPLLNRGDIELERLKGSWAGALGQPQFMPSSYLRYAQDFDGDGRRDIWSSAPDVFASVAYYLQQRGWKKGQLWGREVIISKEAAAALADLPRRTEGCRARREMSLPQPLTAWRKLGLKTVSRQPVPASALQASLVRDESRAFLVYDNYEALLDYNCAHSYALSIALLSDRLK